MMTFTKLMSNRIAVRLENKRPKPLMGDILSSLEEYQDSISYHKESYSIYTDLEMPIKAAAQLANLSIPYYYLEQNEKAHQHIDEAIALAKKYNDEKLVEQMKGMKNRYN